MTELEDACCASGAVPSPIAEARGTERRELPRPTVGRLGPSHSHGGQVPICFDLHLPYTVDNCPFTRNDPSGNY